MRVGLLPFEKKVLAGLGLCGVRFDDVSGDAPLGAAVSGGADSVSLLLALHAIFGSGRIRVITVSHGIRPEEESAGDARFVRDLCGSLGVSCHIEKIAQGEVERRARAEGQSVEAVAREERYAAFGSFAGRERLLALALAHNQNDQAETVLMRFLQGSVEGAGGIARARGKIVRPLLDIPRADIEAYLAEKNAAWRTDSTNSDTRFLRNRVRNVLVPVLDDNFAGWQGAVLSGARKAASDEDFFKKALAGLDDSGDFCGSAPGSAFPRQSAVKMSRDAFFALHGSLKRRVFFSALNGAGFGGRFPYRLFEEVASWRNEKSRSLSFENVLIRLDLKSLEISLRGAGSEKAFIEGGFSFLLRRIGDVAETESLIVRAEADSANPGRACLVFEKNPARSGQSLESERVSLHVSLPVLVRSAVAGDKIRTADGKYKSLAHILSGWKLPAGQRGEIPVVEAPCAGPSGEAEISAVIASPFGADNWIVGAD